MSADCPPAAGLDRRFYAFVLDRLLVWGTYAVAIACALRFLFSEDRVVLGIVVAGAPVALDYVLLAGLLGRWGTSPGKALVGLRVVGEETGAPIGVPAALLRGLILGLATLPTAGLGLATLAWTAVMDDAGRRRGWHDYRAHSLVVDVRPLPTVQETGVDGPRQLVNLTAMRLVSPDPAPAGTGPSAAEPSPEALPTSAPAAEPAVAARPRAGGWRVTFDTGESFVVEGLALVGRRPQPQPGEPVRHVVPLKSVDLSISKTHAQFQVVPDGALVLMDRGSRNGSVIIRHGIAKPLVAGRPATLLDGDTVRFGDRRMTVEKR